jgi:Oxygenase domain of the 2OGFeDO superfamily
MTVKTIHVEKKIPDEAMHKIINTHLKPSQIDRIIRHDTDVYTKEGKLLLKFRKGVLPKDHVQAFYDNVIHFAKTKSTKNRGSTTGSQEKDIRTNPAVFSNIMGYFDRWSPMHKYMFKTKRIKTPLEVRETLFNAQFPDKFSKMVPMIEDVDRFYKKYVPDAYARQIRKANETFFRIGKTSFTTITTNVNFQTSVHTDKGDDAEGFGNLVVIEEGRYTGGETCFPQYGIGVDVRTNDVLFMDVHQWHANLPVRKIDPDAIRLSVVCYLRTKVWLRTRNKSRRFFDQHNRTVRNIKGTKVA